MSVSGVSFNEDILVVTVDNTAPPTAAITPAPAVVEIAGSGLQGPPGPAGAAGPPGPQGPAGTGGGFYKHDQMAPSDVWTVNHNLGFRPNVTVSDSANTTVEGQIEHVDTNTLILTFTASFAGTADCS